MKRKILTITLCVVLLFALTFSLTSCGSAQTFTIGNLSIELNSTYVDVASMVPVGEEVETFAAYLSLFDGMVVIPTFAPDTYGELTMFEYVDAYASLMNGEISYYNDIPVVSYEEESDDYVPLPGDLIFYHWECTDEGDCVAWSDHVGIVVGTAGDFIKVIEGNYGDAVGYHTIWVDHQEIRGYGLPKYS